MTKSNLMQFRITLDPETESIEAEDERHYLWECISDTHNTDDLDWVEYELTCVDPYYLFDMEGIVPTLEKDLIITGYMYSTITYEYERDTGWETVKFEHVNRNKELKWT